MLPTLIQKLLKEKDFISFGKIHLIGDESLINTILVLKSEQASRGGEIWKALDPMLGNSIITANGDAHLGYRFQLRDNFTLDKIKTYQDVVDKAIENFFDIAYSNTCIFNANDEMKLLAGTVLQKTVFNNADYNVSELTKCIEETMLLSQKAMLVSFLPKFLRPKINLQKSVEKLNNITSNIKVDFLVGNTEEIQNNINALIVAGQDTVAASMSWMLSLWANEYEFCKSQTPQQLVNLILKLRPAIWFLPRVVTEDFITGAMNNEVLNCKKDDMIIMFPLVSQMKADSKILSFGSGIHKCIGMHLAKMELLSLAKFLYEHDIQFKTAKKANFNMSTAITLWPKKPLLELQ